MTAKKPEVDVDAQANEMRAKKRAKLDQGKVEEAEATAAVQEMEALRQQYQLGHLVPVRCDLAKYPGLIVAFDTSIPIGVILRGEVFDEDGLGVLRRYAAMAPKFVGWKLFSVLKNKDLPAPDASNIESYKVLSEEAADLASWLLGVGLLAARRAQLGNSQAASKVP